MKVLFARIGYMQFYSGPKPKDERPLGGGAYNKNEIGHEVYNFARNGEQLLKGYFQPNMTAPYQINLKRIDPDIPQEADNVDDVLVIWFAKHPNGAGSVIIGWYEHATVYRIMQNPQPTDNRDDFGYYVTSKPEDCTLLPISYRTFEMGHTIQGVKEGKPGQSNTFYIRQNNGELKDLEKLENSWIKVAIDYVVTYSGEKLDGPLDEINEDIRTSLSTSGQGYQSDVETRLAVEKYAMKRCKQYFESQHYVVENTSATKPYDFQISKDGMTIYVEVKGTQGLGNSVLFTENEVKIHSAVDKNTCLYLLHSIKMKSNKTVKTGSGVEKIFLPFSIKPDNLKVTHYSYKIE